MANNDPDWEDGCNAAVDLCNAGKDHDDAFRQLLAAKDLAVHLEKAAGDGAGDESHLVAVHKAAALHYNLGLLHMEGGDLQAAATELLPVLPHLDVLDDDIALRITRLLAEVYLRQGNRSAASDLVDDMQARFGAQPSSSEGSAANEGPSTPSKEWAALLLGLRVRLATVAGDLAAAQLSLEILSNVGDSSGQAAELGSLRGGLAFAGGDLAAAKASIVYALFCAAGQDLHSRAVAACNMGCVAGREGQHNVALLCFSRALSGSTGADAAAPPEALDSTQMAHVLRCAAAQHAALGDHAAAVRCMHAAATMTPLEPTLWLHFARVLAAVAADSAASKDAISAVLSLLGTADTKHCTTQSRLVGCAELALDNAEHLLEIARRCGGHPEGPERLVDEVAAQRIELRHMQGTVPSLLPSATVLPALWDTLQTGQIASALAMLRDKHT